MKVADTRASLILALKNDKNSARWEEFVNQYYDYLHYAAYQVDSPWTEAIWDDFMGWFETDEKAVPFRHLDFSEELAEVRSGFIRPPVGMPGSEIVTQDGDTKW